MKVYVFGTEEYEPDSMAIRVARVLQKKRIDIEFVFMKVNEDLPFEDGEDVVILDTVEGLDEVRVIEDIDRLMVSNSGTVHDYDLGFQLKYLKKLGRLGKVKIIGVPMEGDVKDSAFANTGDNSAFAKATADKRAEEVLRRLKLDL